MRYNVVINRTSEKSVKPEREYMAKILDEYRIESTSLGEIIDLRKLSTLDVTPLKEFVNSKLKSETEKMRNELRKEISDEFNSKLETEKQKIESKLIVKHNDDVSKITKELISKDAKYTVLEKTTDEKYKSLKDQLQDKIDRAVADNSLLKEREISSKQAELEELKNQVKLDNEKINSEKEKLESDLVAKHKDDVLKISKELIEKAAAYAFLEKSSEEKYNSLMEQLQDKIDRAVADNSLLKEREISSKQVELEELKNQVKFNNEKINSDHEKMMINEKAVWEKEIAKLETKLGSIEKQTETRLNAESKVEIVKLQSNIKELQDKLELNKKVFDSTKEKLIAEKNVVSSSVNEKVREATKELEEQIQALKFENQNSKFKGENFEKFIQDKLECLTVMDGIDYIKTTNAISGKKPDFKFNYGKHGSIAIECKNSPNFGSDWLKTLNINMGNFKCKYGILVWNSLENKFPIKKEGDIFIVNHEIFEHCLGMIASIMSMENLSEDPNKTDQQLTDIVNWINKNLKVELESIEDYASKTIKNSETIIKNQDKIKNVITKRIFRDYPIK